MRDSIRKFKAKGKRLLSLMLCAIMVISLGQGITLQAATEKKKRGTVYLDSKRIPQDSLPEGNYLYFGTAAAIVEERGKYAVRIYREGDLDKEASVEVHTIDMTAVYGKDYELVMDEVKKVDGAGEYSLLEQYAKGKKNTESKTEEYPSVSFKSKTDSSVSSSAVSSLAKKREEQTGTESRQITEMNTETKGLLDDLTESFLDDAVNDMEYSASCNVTFEAGEDEKIIEFRILEDEKSEGTEGFCLTLANPENIELYEVGSLSVSIRDDEAVNHSQISFSKPEYTAKDGKAVLTVKRTGAEYSVCDMTVLTCEDTAKAGTNYTEKNETLAFAPYETEKKIEMDVTGKGSFDVLLTDLKACTQGEYIKARVNIAQSTKKASIVRKAASDDTNGTNDTNGTKSFNIKIKNKDYAVEYKIGDTTGKIMDDSYSPAVEAGVYYFSSDEEHGGMFTYGERYGSVPGWNGNCKSEYIYNENNSMEKNFGKLEYYHSLTTKKGGASTHSTRTIPGAYYQYFVNDWRSKDGFGGGQRAKLVISGEEPGVVKGDFSRTQDRGVVKNTQDGYVYAEAHAYDDSSTQTPKSYVEFYGLCAMYKKFTISMLPIAQLPYRTGTSDSYEEVTPVQVSVKCGAQVLYREEERDIYANMDENQSNLVFTISDNTLNGHTGKFGHITGYSITVDAKEAEKKKTVDYPKDFIKYLESKKGKGSQYDSVNFSAEAVEKEIKKVNANLDTIPYDGYFLYWIKSIQKVDDLQGDGYGYKGVLKFKPIVAYDDVTVEVLPANGKGTGHFTDSQLKQTGKYTFHAGDSLTLDAVADNTDNYHAGGYQYSVDGGISYNTISDGSDLFLESGKNYLIRPVISANDNAIEVQFASDSASSGLEIQGLISQDELKGTEFEGKNILNLNPDEKDVVKKARPVPGKDYAVRIVVNEKEKGDMVYRPTVKMKSKNTVYTTQCFYMVAASDTKDNIITVDLSSVKKSQLKEYQVVGNLVSKFSPIRSTGLETKELPLSGYTMSLGTGKQNENKNEDSKIIETVETVASTTGSTGAYTLMDISGCSGDIIPILISNGVSNGQVVDVKLTDSVKTEDGTAYKVDKGNTVFGYPDNIPCVKSVDYQYDKDTNNQKSNLTYNSVNIYDDTFKITAKVNTNGRSIKEAVFTVYTVTGQTEEYHVTETKGNKNTFVCTIPKMTENLHNGDRIKVRLVDNEELFSAASSDPNEKIYDDEGNEITGNSVAIEYPDVDTGLVFFVENELVQPQHFELENTQAVNVPMLGVTTSNAGSGMITFGKTEWDSDATGKKTGYTLQVGFDAMYSSIKNLTTEDKIGALTKFHQDVKGSSSGESESNAEDIILDQNKNIAGDKEEKKAITSNLKSEKNAMEETVDTLKKDRNSKAKEAVAGLNKNKKLNVDIALLLAFDFVYNPATQEYEFYCGSVSIGGTFAFNKTYYTNIEGVPLFVNITATVQLSELVAYDTPSGNKALSAGDFNNYTGNLAERLKSTTSTTDLMFSGKLQIGEGMCGVLAVRGYVSLKLQFELRIDFDPSDPSYTDDFKKRFKGGAMIDAAGGIGYDLLLFSININYGQVTGGWGTLESQPKFSFFGGLLDVPLTNKTASGLFGTSGNKDAVLKTYDDDKQLLLHQYSAGTSDMSGFGKSNGGKRATLGAVSVSTILDNAAEHARPRIIPLGDDKKMIVFIGNRGDGDEMNSMALYYSIYDGSQWSQPQMVANDGTVDSTPDILKQGDKVIIAWADANRKFTSDDINSKTNKLKPSTLSTMNISVAVYDISSGSMGDEITLIDDGNFNLSPKININGEKFYCSYMKRDVANVEDEIELLDFSKIYSTIAYVTYNFGGDIQEGEKRLSSEKFIEFPHETIEDPLVMDFKSVTAEVDGDTYLLSTYTIDEDENLNTPEDRELYLQVYNASKDRRYYPVRISNDNVNQANPSLTNLNGTVYLTWLEEGYMFQMMNVSDFIEGLFDTTSKTITLTDEDSSGNIVKTDITVQKEKFIDSYMTGDNENKDWYKQSAESLGIEESYYKDSLYADLVDGDFHVQSGNFRQNPEVTTSISDYKIVSDGKDIYIFFTELGSEEGSTGLEIYGVKYQRGSHNKESASGDDNTEQQEVSAEEYWSFGKAVQITDNNKVIDEMDMYMTEDNRISVVSNYYSQWVDNDGNMQYGTNQITEIDFEPQNSLELEDDAITLPARLVGGEQDQLSFKVKNNGLLTAKGFDYTVSQIKEQTETIIQEGHNDDFMETAESISLTVPWSVPEDVSNTFIKVSITESGVANSKPITVMKEVPYRSSLCFEDTQILWNENTPYVGTTLINKGNASSKAYKGTLSMVDINNKEVKTYKEFDIPAIASGESKTFELPFTPGMDDFGEQGIIELKLAALDGEESVETGYVRFVVSSPVCAQINNGAKKINLESGKTTTLQTKAAPWNEIAGDIRFYSSNQEVAAVDAKGVVHATGKGNATVYAYYLNTGLTTSIDVSVSENQTKTVAATKKITADKSDVVIAAGKSKEVKYKATADTKASKAAAVTAAVSGNKKVSAKISGSKVVIKVDKNAEKGSSATVTLKSKNNAGKTVKTDIKVKVQNKTKSLKAASKSLTIKKGKKAKLVLNVTAQNKKKATTDTVKLSSDIVALNETSATKGKITLTLKGMKKGTKKVTIKVGSKSVKVQVTVR